MNTDKYRSFKKFNWTVSDRCSSVFIGGLIVFSDLGVSAVEIGLVAARAALTGFAPSRSYLNADRSLTNRFDHAR